MKKLIIIICSLFFVLFLLLSFICYLIPGDFVSNILIISNFLINLLKVINGVMSLLNILILIAIIIGIPQAKRLGEYINKIYKGNRASFEIIKGCEIFKTQLKEKFPEKYNEIYDVFKVAQNEKQSNNTKNIVEENK